MTALDETLDSSPRSGATLHQEPPWYRQFWPWALIALPSSAVIAGIATLFIAMHDPDGLVVDDYYKAGLAINRSIERERTAQELGVRGRLMLGDETLQLDLAASAGPVAEAIHLRLAHATRAGNDQEVRFAANAKGHYSSDLAALPPGRWHVTVETAEWRIAGELKIPGSGVATLGDIENP